MKKKIISALLCASMVATMVAGCGGSSDTTSTDNSNSGAAAPATESGSDAAETDTTGDEGKVLNIYCWNEEFKSRLTDHYPGYEEVDATSGNDWGCYRKMGISHQTMTTHIRTIWMRHY